MTTPSTPAGTAETLPRGLEALTRQSEDAIWWPAQAAIARIRELELGIAQALHERGLLSAENERLTAEIDAHEVEQDAWELDFNRMKSAREQAEAALAEATGLLAELHAMVWGECPSLLNEDSGGSAELDIKIRDCLSPAAAASPHPTAERNEGHE